MVELITGLLISASGCLARIQALFRAYFQDHPTPTRPRHLSKPIFFLSLAEQEVVFISLGVGAMDIINVSANIEDFFVIVSNDRHCIPELALGQWDDEPTIGAECRATVDVFSTWMMT
jgi:hypothetical protein